MNDVDRKYLENGFQFRRVPLVGEDFKSVPMKNLVGVCHNILHEGYLDVRLLKKHDCVAKQCRYLEKFEEYPFWVHQYNIERNKERKREERRKEMQEEQARQRDLERKMNFLRDASQEMADELRYPIKIIKVTLLREEPKGSKFPKRDYLVNYLSESKQNDSRDYFPLAVQMRRKFGGKYYLWHCKLPNGEFATIEEWSRLSEKRK